MWKKIFPENKVRQYMELVRKKELQVVYWGTGYWGSQFGYQELKKNGFSPDFFCDNNSELWGKEIIDGIYCVDYNSLLKKQDGILFVITVATYNIAETLVQLQKLGIDHILPCYVILEHFHFAKDYFDFIEQDRIAAYTCVTGGYESIREPAVYPDKYDYYLISDDEPGYDTAYKWINIQDVLPSGDLDNTRKNRYCKINAHKIFPDYRRSIYYDANMIINKDLALFFDEMKTLRLAYTAPNNWCSIYDEAVNMMVQRRDIPEKIYAQVKRYWMEGMPERFGGATCNIMLREHNNPTVVRLMEDWWEEVKNESCRDQLSFPYVVWKHGYTMDDILFMSGFFQSEYWSFTPHPKVFRAK